MKHLTNELQLSAPYSIYRDTTTLINFLYFVSEHNNHLVDDALSCISLKTFYDDEREWIDFVRSFIIRSVPTLTIHAYMKSPEVYV